MHKSKTFEEFSWGCPGMDGCGDCQLLSRTDFMKLGIESGCSETICPIWYWIKRTFEKMNPAIELLRYLFDLKANIEQDQSGASKCCIDLIDRVTEEVKGLFGDIHPFIQVERERQPSQLKGGSSNEIIERV